ncbi:MAG: putative dynein heavy chain axonemal [Streblomastix strix]|uniref:Putative dynein heavy chain axonemal n=1 Tax=Streblomastix strix TaxID=222440 RepID=A0A5J4WJE0_9EUKA|nr:MAG: putative dynein heavy chain axonemal [Streblomastix strix]
MGSYCGRLSNFSAHDLNSIVIKTYSQLPTTITHKFIIKIVVSLISEIAILIALNVVVVVYVYMHVSVEKASTRFLTELKKHNYTTPSSYLELLNLYHQILKQMIEVIATRQSKLSNRLITLERTNKEVEAMKTQLIAILPRLEVSQKDTIAIMAELTVQQKEVDGKEEIVCEEVAIVTLQANEAEALAEDAQNNLNKAIPKYNAAIKTVQSLEKIDIFEDKSYFRPHELVMFVMAYVCLLFGQPQTWEQAKKQMNAQFLVVENVSNVAKSQYSYSHVAKEVEPKRAKVKESMEKLELMLQALAKKKFELHGVEDKNAYIKAKYDASVSKKAKIEDEIEASRVKLIRVEKLLS